VLVCVCVCVRERERERMSDGVSESEREREREREREGGRMPRTRPMISLPLTPVESIAEAGHTEDIL
jgi:hypothetical protein